jgi:fermentation-respiration switch protein FrsA (DUF1100 family)
MDTVTEPVTFTSGGETLAGRLVLPAGLPDGRLPGVVIAGGQTCVKEQMAQRYAHRLAEHGYVSLAFDFRGFGESGGRPRDYESPGRKIEDIRSALSFLADRPSVNPGRLAALGIGVGAGYVATEAAGDARVAALALVAPGLQDSQIVRDRYGGAEGVARQRARGEAARRRYEQTGQVDYEPVVSPGDPPGVVGYFLNPERGGVPQWSNRFAVLAMPEWLTFDPISAAPKITVPTLLVHSEQATDPVGAHRFFGRLPGPKTELWTDGIQFDFYDQEPQVTVAVGAIIDHLRTTFEC